MSDYIPIAKPEGVIDFRELEEIVCQSLFEQPHEDAQLDEVLSASKDALEAALVKIGKWPEYRQPPVPLGAMSKPIRARKLDHPQAYAVRAALIETNFAIRAIDERKFDTAQAFTYRNKGYFLNTRNQSYSFEVWLAHHAPPAPPSFRLGHSNAQKLPALVNAVGRCAALWTERRNTFALRVREALTRGSLVAHWITPTDGLWAFSNQNVWYDDASALTALTAGRASPVGSQNPFPIYFLRNQALATFPPRGKLESEKGTDRAGPGRPADLGQSVQRCLNRLCPDGYISSEGTKSDLRRRVEKILGQPLKVSHFNKLVDEHNERLGVRF